jgi:hypothetical protein
MLGVVATPKVKPGATEHFKTLWSGASPTRSTTAPVQVSSLTMITERDPEPGREVLEGARVVVLISRLDGDFLVER